MNIELVTRLFSYLKPHKKKVIFALIASVVVGALSTSPIPVVKLAFDDIFLKQDYAMLKLVPALMILLYLVKGSLSYIQNLIIMRLGWELVVELRLKMFSHIHLLPFVFFEKGTTGQLISRIISDVNLMMNSLIQFARDFLKNIIMVVGLTCWMFYLKWDWALYAIIIFPLAIVPVSTISRKLRKLGRRGQEILADINSTILESFSGIKTVRAFGLENAENEKFFRQNNRFLEIRKKGVKYTQITSPLMEVLGVIVGSGVLWFGGEQVLDGKVSQGTFIAFVLAMFMMYAPLRKFFNIFTKVQAALACAERVFWILDREKESVKDGGLDFPGFENRIEYKNVSFKYPSRSALVLDNINFTVDKSEIVALVGMSGAGKTTMVDLLFKFFEVTSGQILIDGVDIRKINGRSLRDNLALVTQETFLFNDTIRNNILFGNPNASREDVLEAGKAARVEHFVENLDDGYETMIGERGVMLSGGQRQRIAIARAILRNAPILVLDEATSALDSESEKLVQEALHNLMEERTTLIIAHRLSTIKHADKIVVIEGGKIAGTGTHDELLSDCPIYQKYYEIQFVDISDASNNRRND
ncbi:MAG: ABC transporter ATP-binding protein [Nitrospinae bacterium]|nr:ABC transporter ATP-binding protein [Nitrospinota bacterium]